MIHVECREPNDGDIPESVGDISNLWRTISGGYLCAWFDDATLSAIVNDLLGGCPSTLAYHEWLEGKELLVDVTPMYREPEDGFELPAVQFGVFQTPYDMPDEIYWKAVQEPIHRSHKPVLNIRYTLDWDEGRNEVIWDRDEYVEHEPDGNDVAMSVERDDEGGGG